MTMYMNDEKLKKMPQAVEIEELVLSALMTEGRAIERINLKADDFYLSKHQIIFTAMQRLQSRFAAIDMFTICEELNKMGELENIGGQYFITGLAIRVASSVHLISHSEIIKQKSIARKLINISAHIQDMSYDEQTDVSDVLEFFEKNITDISVGSSKCEIYSMTESLNETIRYIQTIQANAERGIKTSISTGLNNLNQYINGGWTAPDLIVLGGRPSMGKTQFAVKFAKEAAKEGKKPLFISIEMTKIQLVMRMITENDLIDYYKIKTGQLSSEEWRLIDLTINQIADLNINIADGSNVRELTNIKSMARQMARKGDLDLLIIDYLQLIKTGLKFGTRDLEIGYITGELKNLAKELNIPIILLAQLNRPQKGVKVSTPKLEDLRESGNIEQDADIVLFPHRPSYYDENAVDADGNSWKNRGYIVIGKSREGERDKKIYFGHDERFKKIWDANQTEAPF